jgi:drug/metabolite transporter superfamily protein YnfA
MNPNKEVRANAGGKVTILITLTVLIGAAILEVGGIALVRTGLLGARGWIIAGGASLILYGLLVNQGMLDFGRLMGAYIAVFFVVSQIIAAALFHELPGRGALAGGALIIAGGAVMLLL